MMIGNVQGNIGLFGILPSANRFEPPTTISKENYEEIVKRVFGNKSTEVLALYPSTGDEAISQFNAVNEDAMTSLQLSFAKARSIQGEAPIYVLLRL
jgi:hypothetical protein